MSVRTTVILDDDVANAVDSVREEQKIGLSQALNLLVRRGLSAKEPKQKFVQTTSHMGKPKLPIDNIAELLDVLEGEARK